MTMKYVEKNDYNLNYKVRGMIFKKTNENYYFIEYWNIILFFKLDSKFIII